MSEDQVNDSVLDPEHLATLPPPPITAASANGTGADLRAIASAWFVRASAAMAGLSAGPRRPPRPRGPVDALRTRVPAGLARVSAAAAAISAGPRRQQGAGDDLDEIDLDDMDGIELGQPVAEHAARDRLATLPPPPVPVARAVAGPPARQEADVVVVGDQVRVGNGDGDRPVMFAPAAHETPWGSPPPGGHGDGSGDTGTVGPGTERDTAEIEVVGPTRSRWQRRREWRKVERARRYAARHSVRFPIFTRSILLWMLVFALTGTASGAIAAGFWAHFNTQIAELREQTMDFDRRSQAAEARLDALRNQAVGDIDNRMKELAPALAEPRTVQAAAIVSPYVWFVTTLDDAGMASVGSAFSVASDETSTWLLTSYSVVRAGTTKPSPAITLRKDPDEAPAELVSWDSAADLALLRMDRANQPVLEWAPDDVQARLVGTRVYIVTGFGGAGATLNSAMTIDQNAAGILHDGRIGTAGRGGPMVTTDGKVVGVASLTYQPLGFDSGELHYAPAVRRACDVLLSCTTQTSRVKAPNR